MCLKSHYLLHEITGIIKKCLHILHNQLYLGMVKVKKVWPWYCVKSSNSCGNSWVLVCKCKNNVAKTDVIVKLCLIVVYGPFNAKNAN